MADWQTVENTTKCLQSKNGRDVDNRKRGEKGFWQPCL